MGRNNEKEKLMQYQTVIFIQRQDKDICIFLKRGEHLSLENIVDVRVYDPKEDTRIE